MLLSDMNDRLERCPVIAAVKDNQWQEAINSPASIIFHLKANVMTAAQAIAAAHEKGKAVFIHIDLTEGIGKDRAGVEFLSKCGVDGIISTRGQLIRYAKEMGLLTVQRFFTFDSQGVCNIEEMTDSSLPDFIEIMPGVIPKTIERFAGGNVPVIAGGLLETKAEVVTALSSGAAAVSTGKSQLWYID